MIKNYGEEFTVTFLEKEFPEVYKEATMPSFLDRMIMKRALKKAKKKMGDLKKRDEKTRKKLIKTLWQLTEDFDIYEDEEQTKKTTYADLEKKSIDELESIFKEIMELTEKGI